MTTPSPNELKPCPFCGGEAELEPIGDGGWSVGCKEKALGVHYCMGFQSLTSFATKAEAIKAWNTRTPDTSYAKGIEDAAKVAESHRCGEQLIRLKMMSEVDQVGIVSMTIAKAIRSLSSPRVRGEP